MMSLIVMRQVNTEFFGFYMHLFVLIFFFVILGLYWDLEPSKTLARGPLSGKKKSKKRVTILLTCNATGTEKLTPFFIHTSKNPRALKGKKKDDLPVNYYWNKTAWMQVSIWNDYLKKLDTKMRLQNRKILLLVDNAPVHITNENTQLTNVTLHFLPPNTTSHLQPCDAGIINSFKVSIFFLLLFFNVLTYTHLILGEVSKTPCKK